MPTRFSSLGGISRPFTIPLRVYPLQLPLQQQQNQQQQQIRTNHEQQQQQYYYGNSQNKEGEAIPRHEQQR